METAKNGALPPPFICRLCGSRRFRFFVESGSFSGTIVFCEAIVFARFGFFALFCVLVSPVLAADYPYSAMLYGTKDHDQITAQCRTQSETEMACDFTQVHVTKAAKPEDLQEALGKLDEIVKQAKTQPNKSDKELCDNIDLVYEAINSNKTPPGPYGSIWEKAIHTSPKYMDDIRAAVSSFIGFCKSLSKKTIETLIRIVHEKNSRTCKVFANEFSQKFTLDINKNWVSKESSGGQCGVINVSVFKKAKDSNYWTYRTQKIITNNDDKNENILNCSYLDKNEYFYDWKAEEIFLGCDYIKFGF
jgi:hypothetical protein